MEGLSCIIEKKWGIGFMILDFNNISVILQKLEYEEKTTVNSLTSFITWSRIEYTFPRMGIKLTTLVVIGTKCIDGYKPNCHTVMGKMDSYRKGKEISFLLQVDTKCVWMTNNIYKINVYQSFDGGGNWIFQKLDLQLPMQVVPITTKVMS